MLLWLILELRDIEWINIHQYCDSENVQMMCKMDDLHHKVL